MMAEVFETLTALTAARSAVFNAVNERLSPVEMYELLLELEGAAVAFGRATA
jgi:predicted component of type VI protein secretion system